MADDTPTIELTLADLRAVADYAVLCALPALPLFERACADDDRPRAAIEAARRFAGGEARSKRLRDSGWAAQRAATRAREEGSPAASEAARAALAAAGAGFLHPLPKATQVKHILGAAAHAARAIELAAGGAPSAGEDDIARSALLASPAVVSVLARYPAAPPGGGRTGALVRQLDALLR